MLLHICSIEHLCWSWSSVTVTVWRGTTITTVSHKIKQETIPMLLFAQHLLLGTSAERGQGTFCCNRPQCSCLLLFSIRNKTSITNKHWILATKSSRDCRCIVGMCLCRVTCAPDHLLGRQLCHSFPHGFLFLWPCNGCSSQLLIHSDQEDSLTVISAVAHGIERLA